MDGQHAVGGGLSEGRDCDVAVQKRNGGEVEEGACVGILNADNVGSQNSEPSVSGNNNYKESLASGMKKVRAIA